MQIKEYSEEERQKIQALIKKHTGENIIPLRRVDYENFIGFVYKWNGIEIETIVFGKDKNKLINRTIRDLKDKKHKKIMYNFIKRISNDAK